jgi:UDP-N-acetylglucosamine--N-acetylmuramyl-(pentapeptide) pyrophosphoryl-undecaprenol N-acetylglucosamine transferase
MAQLALIVAGGTGGHLYPGISVARAIKKSGSNWDVLFVVRKGDLGREILQREGLAVAELPGQGFPRRPSIAALQFPFKLAAGFIQSFALLKEKQPRVVVGMGGYLSFPVLLAARWKGIPTLIHEQNVMPGLANRFLGRWVSTVAVSFAESQAYFKRRDIRVSGLPVRSEIGTVSRSQARKELGLADNLTTFFVFGGSQGARRINLVMIDVWKRLASHVASFQVLHVTGMTDYESVRQAYQSLKVKSVVLPYCHAMASAYAVADLVICRAGASTVAELIAAQRSAIFIPFPHATDNHQFFNAQVMEKKRWAEIILEKDLQADRLASRLEDFLEKPPILHEWPSADSGAAQRLAEFITTMPSKLL